jgi:hypothetical protein
MTIVLSMVMSSFIDPAPNVLSMVMSSSIDPATLYFPWLCRHSLTLLHCTVHGYVVIHWPCYIVLSMVMSSFIAPATLYCSWLCRHSFTLLHGNVVIHWSCYNVLSMVMSSFIDRTVQCSRVNKWRHYHVQYNVAGSMNDDITMDSTL